MSIRLGGELKMIVLGVLFVCEYCRCMISCVCYVFEYILDVYILVVA